LFYGKLSLTYIGDRYVIEDIYLFLHPISCFDFLEIDSLLINTKKKNNIKIKKNNINNIYGYRNT